jgi:hypothetical protein
MRREKSLGGSSPSASADGLQAPRGLSGCGGASCVDGPRRIAWGLLGRVIGSGLKSKEWARRPTSTRRISAGLTAALRDLACQRRWPDTSLAFRRHGPAGLAPDRRSTFLDERASDGFFLCSPSASVVLLPGMWTIIRRARAAIGTRRGTCHVRQLVRTEYCCGGMGTRGARGAAGHDRASTDRSRAVRCSRAFHARQ